MAFCNPDGNGGTNLPNIKPKTLRISISAVIIFIATLIFYAGGKSGDVKDNTSDIVELKIDVSNIDKKLDHKIDEEIKPILIDLQTKMGLLLKDAKITINPDAP